MRRRVWSESNLHSSEGVEPLERRGANQQDEWAVVDPQPKVMIVVVDEADPHANDRSSFSVQYGVVYCLREDDVRDKDRFWFQPHLNGVAVGRRYLWGVVGEERWNINHALTNTNFGVKQFRIRRGG